MVTGQHRAMGSTPEHRATIPRATAPASKTLTPPHPRHAATPTNLSGSQLRDLIGRPKWPPSTRPAAPGARRAQSCCRVRDELSPAAPGARRTMDCSLERANPSTKVAPGR
uniref:Uncharacterized protein n=1 Tax=Aegilops tauschii subsp. strangulata TaxID=200361 RepID=A0A452XZQ6_AEGTS